MFDPYNGGFLEYCGDILSTTGDPKYRVDGIYAQRKKNDLNADYFSFTMEPPCIMFDPYNGGFLEYCGDILSTTGDPKYREKYHDVGKYHQGGGSYLKYRGRLS